MQAFLDCTSSELCLGIQGNGQDHEASYTTMQITPFLRLHFILVTYVLVSKEMVETMRCPIHRNQLILIALSSWKEIPLQMHVCVPNLKGSILSVELHFLLQCLKFHKLYMYFLLDLYHYGS